MGAAPAAPPENVFDLGRDRPQRAYLTAGDVLPPVEPTLSPMLLQLSGVLAELGTREVAALSATLDPTLHPLDIRGDPQRLCVVHLEGKTSRKRIEIFTQADGTVTAREMTESSHGNSGEKERPPVRLDRNRFEQATSAWPLYRGKYEGTGGEGKAGSPDPPGSVSLLPKPYVPGRLFLDQQALGDRFLHGHKSNIPPADRILPEEKFFVRPPKDYDPKLPAGLIVWINAGREGAPPALFFPVLDQLNIVTIGAENSGNDRPVADRYQLALDAAATASRRYHIDPRRVYVTGISGGGRVSSILCGCFPDLFTGAVPIVGLSTYINVPAGPGQAWPAGYQKPPARLYALLRPHRIGTITGPKDFNYDEITHATQFMIDDGLNFRVFDVPGMAHEMPTAERFAEALRWVDEPYRGARAKEEHAASALLGKYTARGGEHPPTSGKERLELVKMTEVGPWTDAGWKAARLLRSVRTPATGK